jgi:hypothetical protein
LALKLGSGLALIPDAALVGVAILGAERLRFTTRGLDVKARELLSNAGAGLRWDSASLSKGCHVGWCV